MVDVLPFANGIGASACRSIIRMTLPTEGTHGISAGYRAVEIAAIYSFTKQHDIA